MLFPNIQLPAEMFLIILPYRYINISFFRVTEREIIINNSLIILLKMINMQNGPIKTLKDCE